MLLKAFKLDMKESALKNKGLVLIILNFIGLEQKQINYEVVQLLQLLSMMEKQKLSLKKPI